MIGFYRITISFKFGGHTSHETFDLNFDCEQISPCFFGCFIGLFCVNRFSIRKVLILYNSIWNVFWKYMNWNECLNLVYVTGRHNQYDGEEEFWVTVRESGKRTETTSYEEMQQKEQEVRIKYVSNLLVNMCKQKLDHDICETISSCWLLSFFP